MHSVVYTNVANQGPSPIILGGGKANTFFTTRASGAAAFDFHLINPSSPQVGGLMSDCTIRSDDRTKLNTDGVYLRGGNYFRFEDVYFYNLNQFNSSPTPAFTKGDGVVLQTVTGDADAPVNIIFERCLFQNCYNGVLCKTGTSQEVGFLTFRNCGFIANRRTGADIHALEAMFQNCGFALNGDPFTDDYLSPLANAAGLRASYNGSTARHLSITNTDFEHNAPVHIALDAIYNLQMHLCELVSNNRSAVGMARLKYGVQIGGAGTGGVIENCLIERSFVKVDSANSSLANPTVMFAIDSASQHTEIRDTKWFIYDSAGQTRFGWANGNDPNLTRIIDDGYRYTEPKAHETHLITATPDTYAPKIERNVITKYRVNPAMPAATVVNVSIPISGIATGIPRVFLLWIENAMAGAGNTVTVNFVNGAWTWIVRAFPGPLAPGTYTSAWFSTDPDNPNVVQITPWV